MMLSSLSRLLETHVAVINAVIAERLAFYPQCPINRRANALMAPSGTADKTSWTNSRTWLAYGISIVGPCRWEERFRDSGRSSGGAFAVEAEPMGFGVG